MSLLLSSGLLSGGGSPAVPPEIVTTSLLRRYEIDEGTGTTLTDYANGHDAAFRGGAASPTWDTWGLLFDDANSQYINLPTTGLPTNATPGTGNVPLSAMIAFRCGDTGAPVKNPVTLGYENGSRTNLKINLAGESDDVRMWSVGQNTISVAAPLQGKDLCICYRYNDSTLPLRFRVLTTSQNANRNDEAVDYYTPYCPLGAGAWAGTSHFCSGRIYSLSTYGRSASPMPTWRSPTPTRSTGRR